MQEGLVYYASFQDEVETTFPLYTQAKFSSEGFLECFVSGQISSSEWNYAELSC